MVGDEAALYQALAPRLEQIVHRDIRAPQAVIEDACQHAWAQFLARSDTVGRQGVLSWLATTAERQAVRLARREQREQSLEQELEQNPEPVAQARDGDPARAAEWRSELERLNVLSQRQRRLIWLQAVGLDYAEIATLTGDSRRTVERQLLRARHSLKTTSPQPANHPTQTTRDLDVSRQPGLQTLGRDHHQRTVRR